MAGEDNTQRYFELLREYYADKGGDVDQLIQMIRMGDERAQQSLQGVPPIHTEVGPSGNSAARWVEDDNRICFLGIITKDGKIPREDRKFAAEVRDHIEDGVVAGKTLQASVNELSRPFLEGVARKLNRRDPPIPVELISNGPGMPVAGLGIWQDMTLRHTQLAAEVAHTQPVAEVTPTQVAVAENTDAVAEFREKGKNLKTPELPYGSICLDGVPYTTSYSMDNTIPSGTFRKATDDPEERLKDVGTYWSHRGVLSWVNEKGEHHIARSVYANTDALNAAGYNGYGIHNKSDPTENLRILGEAGEKWEQIKDTPASENERLTMGVHKGRLAQVEEALANGAQVAHCVDYRNDPVIFDAFGSIVDHGVRDSIVRRLLPLSSLTDHDGNTLLHEAMNTYSESHNIIPDILRHVDPFTLNNHGVPAFLCEHNYKDLEDSRKELNIVLAAMQGSLLSVEERRALACQQALLNHYLDQAEAEKPERHRIYEELSKARKEHAPTAALEAQYEAFHGYRDLSRAFSGLKAIWEDAYETSKKSDGGTPEQTRKIPPKVTEVFDGLIRREGRNKVITSQEAGALLEPVLALAQHNSFGSTLLDTSVRSEHPSSRLIPTLLNVGQDPFSKNYEGTPSFLRINTEKDMEHAKQEIILVTDAMKNAPGITGEESKVIQAQQDVIAHQMDMVSAERKANQQLNSELEELYRRYNEVGQNYVIDEIGEVKRKIVHNEQAKLDNIVSGLTELWKDGAKNSEGKSVRIPEEVTSVLSHLIEVRSGKTPEALTDEQRATLLEPVVALAEVKVDGKSNSGSNDPLLIKALKSPYPAGYIFPSLMSAGQGAFTMSADGVPAFLCVNPAKQPPKEAEAELRFITEKMKKTEGVGEAAKATINDVQRALLQTWKENPTETAKSVNLANGLGIVWKEAKALNPDDKAPVPGELVTLLKPLASTKEAPDFIEFLSQYKGSSTGDMVREVTTHVVLPQMMHRYAEHTGADPMNEDHLREFDGKTAALINGAMPAVSAKLLAGRHLMEREALSTSWHDTVFPDRLVPLKAAGSWHCLTVENDFIVNPDVKREKIITDFSKKEEGRIVILPGSDAVELHQVTNKDGPSDTEIKIRNKSDGTSSSVLVKGADSEVVAKNLAFVDGYDYPELTGTRANPHIITLTNEETVNLQEQSARQGTVSEEKGNNDPITLVRGQVPLRVIDVPLSAFGKPGEGKSGIKLQIETNHDRLVYLSREDVMDHCVGRGGNYTSQCLNPADGVSTHIISVIEDGKHIPLTTIEAKWDGRNRTFTAKQNKGFKNASAYEGLDHVPDGAADDYLAKAKYAELWLKRQLESREIETSYHLGETAASKAVNQRSEFSKTVGFELKPENIGAAFTEYNTNKKRKGRDWDSEKKAWHGNKTSDIELVRAITVNEPVLDADNRPEMKMVKAYQMDPDGNPVMTPLLDNGGKQKTRMVNGQQEVIMVKAPLLDGDGKQVMEPELDPDGKPVIKLRSRTVAGPEEWFEHSGLREDTRHLIEPHIELAKKKKLEAGTTAAASTESPHNGAQEMIDGAFGDDAAREDDWRSTVRTREATHNADDDSHRQRWWASLSNRHQRKRDGDRSEDDNLVGGPRR